MKKRRFKVTKPGLIDKFVNSPKTVDENGHLQFTWLEMLLIARATGLRSKKRRHVVKRFRLVIQEAVVELLEHQKTLDKTV